MNTFIGLHFELEDYKRIYRVTSIRESTNNALVVTLELVAGWDYMNPDMSDVQGWCSADKFIEDVQYETVVFYPLTESFEDCLADNGFVLSKFTFESFKTLDDIKEELKL